MAAFPPRVPRLQPPGVLAPPRVPSSQTLIAVERGARGEDACWGTAAVGRWPRAARVPSTAGQGRAGRAGPQVLVSGWVLEAGSEGGATWTSRSSGHVPSSPLPGLHAAPASRERGTRRRQEGPCSSSRDGRRGHPSRRSPVRRRPTRADAAVGSLQVWGSLITSRNGPPGTVSERTPGGPGAPAQRLPSPPAVSCQGRPCTSPPFSVVLETTTQLQCQAPSSREPFRSQ